MNTPEIIEAITPLIEVFDNYGIAYYIGGSVSSSVYGKRRMTQDVDIIADVHTKHVQLLVTLLKNEYYIDGDMIRDALRHHSSFAILHHKTGIKVDVFILKLDPFSQQEMARATKGSLEEKSRLFYLASPEDIILSKLAWWKMGGSSSSRQWNDIVEVIKTQAPELDIEYLRESAQLINVSEPLDKALVDTGISGMSSRSLQE